METTSTFKHSDTSSSPLNSPPTSSNHNNNGSNHNNHNQSSLPITRSDPNSPYPTTFVTADSSSFKQVVQMLTGSSETNSPKQHQQHQQQQHQQHETPCSSLSTTKGYVIPPIKTTPKKPATKLFERRNSIKHLISPLTSAAAAASSSSPFQTTSFSPRYKQEILSPSLLDFPSLTLSPVTPLVEDPFNKSSPSNFSTTNGIGGFGGGGGGSGPASSSEEEKAIAEKGFFLHPSPNSTPRDSQPQLLPLFPLTSPRISHP